MPLNERRDDIAPLTEYFMSECGFVLDNTNGNRQELTRLCDILSRQHWPGNIRELRARIKNLWLAGQGDLAEACRLASDQEEIHDEADLVEVLEATGWNQSKAAEMLGISEGAVRKRIKKQGISRS